VPSTVTVPNVPDQAVEILLRELRRHGATIIRPHVGYGEITSDIGVIRFWHGITKTLMVHIESKGLFPELMAVGMVRQYVKQAIDAVEH
jgi:hypothetical protein